MTSEEKEKKEQETKSECADSMWPQMFEMMKKCCAGKGTFSDCADMMKSKMGAITGMPCCAPDTGKAGPASGDSRNKT